MDLDRGVPWKSVEIRGEREWADRTGGPMEWLEYYMFASRAACTVLGVVSFAVGPPLSPSTLIAGAFVAIKVSAFWAMCMCPMMIFFHIAEHKQWQWLEVAPGDHFSYPVVFYEWILAAVYCGSGWAALGILIDHRFRKTCVGDHQITCLRYDIACALVLLVGALTAANVILLQRARARSNGPRLLVILFGQH